MSELISVIVLIYRVENYLHECIQSIQNQTYKNLEILLIDDGSDDKCPEICDEYAMTDYRIKVIHKKNGGIDSARKAGILAATGRYVTYVDGDDWIEPQMYEKLYGFAKKYDVEIVESGVIDSCGNSFKNRYPYCKEGCYKDDDFSKYIAPKVLYTGEFFSHGVSPYLMTKLFLKEGLIKYQLMPEPSDNIVDDTMCTFPYIIEARSIYITHECFYHYRVRGNSAKRLIRKDIPEKVMKCYPEWMSRFSGTRSSDNIEQQIQYFTMYLLIAKAAYVFDDMEADTFLKPFGKIRKTDRLVLYGAGTVGIHLKHYIENTDGHNLVCWVDRNYKELRDTLNVSSPEDINTLDYDYVLISILSAEAVVSARESLIAMGVSEEKILWIEPEYLNDPMKLLSLAIYEGNHIINE